MEGRPDLIAIDTNILIYAHRPDLPFFSVANKHVSGLAQGSEAWAIPWPCVHEFYSVVTHPRIFAQPTPIAVALQQIEVWQESPLLQIISETRTHLAFLANLVTTAGIAGPKIHDAKIAAICLQHGVRELWSADRDFSRFPQLKTRNPLVA